MGNENSVQAVVEREGDGNQRRRDQRQEEPTAGERIIGGVVVAGLIGAGIYGISKLLDSSSEKRVRSATVWESPDYDSRARLQGGDVREFTSYRNGQPVENVFTNCDTQREAFRAAKSVSRNQADPMLHPPHHDDDEDHSWHYHPSTHHVVQDDQQKVLHYCFPGTNESAIRELDRQLRDW